MTGTLQSFLTGQLLQPFDTPQLRLYAPRSTVKASLAHFSQVDEGRTVLLETQMSSLDANPGIKMAVIIGVPSAEV